MAMGMCSSSSSPKATKPCSPKAPTSTTIGGSSHQETIKLAEVQKQKLALRQQIDQQQPSAQPPSPSSGGRCSTSNKKTIATNSFRASNWIECQKRFPESPISWLRVSRQFQ